MDYWKRKQMQDKDFGHDELLQVSCEARGDERIGL